VGGIPGKMFLKLLLFIMKRYGLSFNVLIGPIIMIELTPIRKAIALNK
jgi:hypothetical protein